MYVLTLTTDRHSDVASAIETLVNSIQIGESVAFINIVPFSGDVISIFVTVNETV